MDEPLSRDALAERVIAKHGPGRELIALRRYHSLGGQNSSCGFPKSTSFSARSQPDAAIDNPGIAAADP
jgi:hypothetical protein